jgi:hypothetical protein
MCTGKQCESTPYIAILISTSNNPSYYCLYSLFTKIRDKGKIVSAWWGGGAEGGKGGGGGKGRNDPNIVCTYE